MIDMWDYREIFNLKQNGQYHGFGLGSDESPRRDERWQVTAAYVPVFAQSETWSACIDRMPLLEVLEFHCHCMIARNKSGVGLTRILSRQLEPKGLSLQDCLGTVADRGSENVGYRGLHALLTNGDVGVGRNAIRRHISKHCVPHIAWTMVLRIERHELLTHAVDMAQKLHNYLQRGQTWQCLQQIVMVGDAGHPPTNEWSNASRGTFRQHPPHVVENRPESMYEFMAWTL